MQLQNHDGVDSPAPLYLALSTKVKFSHRFDRLLSAVAEGKSLSQLMLLESTEGDQHSINQSKQENVQGSYPQTPNPISGTEPEADSPGAVDADGFAEDEPDLAHRQLEDLEPDPQHYEVGGETDIPAAENQLIANLANRAGENQTSNGSSFTFDSDPNGIRQAVHPIDGPSQSDLNAIPIANKDQNALEETIGEAVEEIYYEDEDNLNPGSSTGSSTIQGDVREVTVDSANQVLKESTSVVKGKDVISIRRDLESDSATVQIGRSSTPSFLADVIEDDFGYAAQLEVTEERPNHDAIPDEYQKPEDELEHHPKTNPATDLHSYGQDPKEARDASNTPEQSPLVSVESSFDEDPNSSYTLIDLNVGTNIPRTDLTEIDIQRNAGSASLVSGFVGASIIEHRHTAVYSNEHVYNKATDPLRGDQNVTDEALTGEFAERALFESMSQNLHPTSDAEEQHTDSDEITFEDDGNEPEPSKFYGSEQNPNSSPGLLKRMRSDHENHDEIDSIVQGRLNSIVFSYNMDLMTMQLDTKRHRSG